MNRLIITLYLALLISGVTDAWGDASCPDAEKPFPAPASEVAEIIFEWLADQGYAVRRESLRPGHIHLAAWKFREEWEVAIRPRSALASEATIVYAGNRPPMEACRRMREYVTGNLLGTAPRATIRRQTVPPVVSDQIETVTCIRARSGQQEVQFSGFVVDPKGLVLCTAHGLTGHQGVTLTFWDGTSVPGVIIRIDLRRDLALIGYSANTRAYVSFPPGRNLLETGDRVFSIGCPNHLRGTLASGTISGPPRRVNNQPLWQAELDIYPGSSGSPVFDTRGHLVAMVKGRYRGTSTIGFLTPVETMIAFLFDENNREPARRPPSIFPP